MTSAAPTSRLGAELLDAAFATVDAGVQRGAIPSAVLAVAQADRLARLEAFGPVQTDSVFLIASITKPIFSTGLLRLVERGQLLLNEPVARLIPEFAANGKGDVRLWHLLTHTSGLDENWTYLQRPRAASTDDWQAMLEVACAAPLQFRPGSRYSYCNPSFLVMAELIRRVTGQDHASYLRQTVLEPFGMHSTAFEPAEGAPLAPVLGTPPWGNESGRARWLALRHPAGGLWSTAEDLVRFGQALLRGGLPVLSPATVRTMTALHTAGIANHTGAGEFAAYYGLGIGKHGPGGERGPSGELRTSDGFGHGGATGTYLWVEPGLDLVFVFLTNSWGIDDDTFRRAMNATIAARSAQLAA